MLLLCLMLASCSMEVSASNFTDYLNSTSADAMVTPAVTFSASTIGNSIAIFVIWRNQRRSDKQSVFYILVMTLATLDLVSTLITSPITFIAYTTKQTVLDLGGKALCFYSGFTMTFFGIASMATVLTMSVERLIAVRFAFFYHTKVNARKTRIVVVAVLGFFLIISALPLVGFGELQEQPPGTWCFMNWKAEKTIHQVYNFIIFAMGIVMMGGTVFCNVFVVVRVITKRRKMKIRNSTLQIMSKRRLRKIAMDETQMMVLLAVMTCVFILCYLPLLLRIFINQITVIYLGKSVPSIWNLFAVRMASINPVLDPWVYILCRRSTILKFFKLTRMLVTCKCTKDDFMSVFSSGRSFKRRASMKSFQMNSTIVNKIEIKRDAPKEGESALLAMKYASKWRGKVNQAQRESNLLEDSKDKI